MFLTTRASWGGGSISNVHYTKMERATISQERIDYLKSVDFTWNLYEEKRKSRFKELKDFKEETMFFKIKDSWESGLTRNAQGTTRESYPRNASAVSRALGLCGRYFKTTGRALEITPLCPKMCYHIFARHLHQLIYSTKTYIYCRWRN